MPQHAACLDPGQLPHRQPAGLLATGDATVIRFVISLFRSAVRPRPRRSRSRGGGARRTTAPRRPCRVPSGPGGGRPGEGYGDAHSESGPRAPTRQAPPPSRSAPGAGPTGQPSQGTRAWRRPQVRQPDGDPDRDEQHQATSSPDRRGGGHRRQQVCRRGPAARPRPRPPPPPPRCRRGRSASVRCSRRARTRQPGKTATAASGCQPVARAVGTSHALMARARAWRAAGSRRPASGRRPARPRAGRRGDGRCRSR